MLNALLVAENDVSLTGKLELCWDDAALVEVIPESPDVRDCSTDDDETRVENED